MFDATHLQRAVPLRLPRLTGKEAQALTLISQRAIDLTIPARGMPPVPTMASMRQPSSTPGNASDVDVTEGGNEGGNEAGHAAAEGENADAAWRLSLSLGDSAAVRAICDQTLRLDWSGALLRVHIPSRAAAVCMAWRLGLDEGGRMDDVDGIAAASVFETMLNEALASLGAQGLGALHLLEQDDDDDDDDAEVLPHVFVLSVQPQDGGARAAGSNGRLRDALPRSRVLGLLETEGLGVMLLAGLLERQVALPNTLRMNALRVPLRFVIGEAVLRIDMLRALRPGDIVRCVGSGGSLWGGERELGSVADDAQSGAQSAGQSAASSLSGLQRVDATAANGDVWRMAIARDDQGALDRRRVIFLELGDAVTSLDNDKTELVQARPTPITLEEGAEAGLEAGSDPGDGASEPLVTLDQLPVTLTFDLGTKTIALADLQRMQPGQAIDLEHGLNAPVRIRANGLLIGQGDMVEIDGALGVVVAELFESAAP